MRKFRCKMLCIIDTLSGLLEVRFTYRMTNDISTNICMPFHNLLFRKKVCIDYTIACKNVQPINHDQVVKHSLVGFCIIYTYA